MIVYKRDDDPRCFATLEECKNAAPYDGPFDYDSYFRVIDTPQGRRFVYWGNQLGLINLTTQAGLRLSDRLDIPRPRTYAELRKVLK